MFSYGCWKSETIKDFHLSRYMSEQHNDVACLPNASSGVSKEVLQILRILNLVQHEMAPCDVLGLFMTASAWWI